MVGIVTIDPTHVGTWLPRHKAAKHSVILQDLPIHGDVKHVAWSDYSFASSGISELGKLMVIWVTEVNLENQIKINTFIKEKCFLRN